MAQADPERTEALPDQRESDAVAPNLDGLASEAAALAARTGGKDEASAPFVHSLQEQAEAALAAEHSAPAVDGAAGDWSPRRRLMFFVGVNAFCWALILTPFLI